MLFLRRILSISITPRLTLVLLTILSTMSLAEAKRVALVIGNSDYLYTPALTNPTNDAKAVSLSLERLGFEVVQGIDLDQREMVATVRAFSKKLDGAEAAFFYYAGHGIQIDGGNFLLATDSSLEDVISVRYETLDVSSVVELMEQKSDIAITVLDACRNNPLSDKLKKSLGDSRSALIGRGLAPIETDKNGVVFAYSAAPGEIAADGDGDNSPYTESLLAYLEEPGLEIGRLFRKVSGEVIEKSNGSQNPELLIRLPTEFYLKQEVKTEVASIQNTTTVPENDNGSQEQDLEISYWESVRESQDVALFDLFLEEFPDGKFAKLAILYRQKLIAAQNKATADVAVETKPEAVVEETTTIVKTEPVLEAIAANPEVDNSTEVAKLWKDAVEEESAANEQSMATGTGEILTGKELVKAVQTELNRIGCPAGKADGVAGAKTKNALSGYRQTGGPDWARGFSQKLLEQLKKEEPRPCVAKVRSNKKSKSGNNPLKKPVRTFKKLFKIN